MNILGNRIKLLREELGLNQKELAVKLSIGNTTLSQYENGQRIPSDEIKIKLADLFGVSLDYLMGRTDIREEEPHPTAEGDEDEISEEEIYTIAAHRVGHEGPLTGEEMERIKMALKIALAKNGK